MEVGELYQFRSYQKSDLSFIQNSWGSSYYKGAEFIDFMSPREFNAQHRPIREKILNKPNIAVVIACNPNDPDLILGWMLVEKPMKAKGIILHYLYIKATFKGEGIAEKMIEKLANEHPIMISHMTDRARKIIINKKYYFKDFFYAPDSIMVRDKYLSALPKLENYEPRGEM